MTVDEARTASLAAKSAIKQGRDPHRERLASAASSVAQRSIVPTTAGEVAALYAETIGARTHLSDRTRRKIIHYVNKAIRIIGGETVALAAIDTRRCPPDDRRRQQLRVRASRGVRCAQQVHGLVREARADPR